jgi:uncharacterized protein (DUF302 family)
MMVAEGARIDQPFFAHLYFSDAMMKIIAETRHITKSLKLHHKFYCSTQSWLFREKGGLSNFMSPNRPTQTRRLKGSVLRLPLIATTTQINMSYQYSKNLRLPFDEVIETVEDRLQAQGFTVITSMDVKSEIGNELGVTFRNYTILSACIPELCYRAISLEPHIGIVLPCNIVVQEHENGIVEISGVNPLEAMDPNMVTPSLEAVAAEVSIRLRTAIDTVRTRQRVVDFAYN